MISKHITTDIEKIVIKADLYLKYFGKNKNLDWFDMSHLLSCIFPQYEKEEILNIQFKTYKEK